MCFVVEKKNERNRIVNDVCSVLKGFFFFFCLFFLKDFLETPFGYWEIRGSKETKLWYLWSSVVPVSQQSKEALIKLMLFFMNIMVCYWFFSSILCFLLLNLVDTFNVCFTFIALGDILFPGLLQNCGDPYGLWPRFFSFHCVLYFFCAIYKFLSGEFLNPRQFFFYQKNPQQLCLYISCSRIKWE